MNTSVANFANSVTGNVSKGYLLIKKAKTEPNQAGPSNQGASANKAGLGNALGAVNDAAGKVSKMKATLNKAKNALNPMRASSAITAGITNLYDTIEVQYNPGSLTMNTTRGDILNRSPGGTGENAYQQYNVTARTTLSVELLFDRMNLFDAFNLENVTSTTMVKDFGKQVVTSLKDQEYSVRPIVEAFIGTTARAENRYVIFVWNHMAFSGELTGVDAQYTMFNRKGEPVRARVGLQIYQANRKTVTGIETTDQYWIQAYDRMFNGTLSGGASTIGDFTNNLFNL